jgi:hypothetical protein
MNGYLEKTTNIPTCGNQSAVRKQTNLSETDESLINKSLKFSDAQQNVLDMYNDYSPFCIQIF